MRAEDEFDEPAPHLASGTATPAQGSEDEHQDPIATFWLPDPEARRGWSMHHVWRIEPPKERNVGFRKR